MNCMRILKSSSLLLAVTMSLLGCGSDDPPPEASSTGFVNVAITDAPVDSALKVCVEFESLEFKHADDSVPNKLVIIDPPEQIDLLAQQGSDSAPLLLGEEMQSGQYNWVRLGVNAPRGAPTMSDDGDAGTDCVPGGSYIKLDTDLVHNLYVPSAAQTGLKLNRGFVLPAGGNASFTIDFDLRKSITAPPGQSPDHMLKPSLRMVDNAAAGTLRGSVDPQLVADAGCSADPVVYVFTGSVTPDDYDGDEGDALTSAMVETQDGGVTYAYEVGFLAAGAYTVAFSCSDDDVSLDEDTSVVSFEPAAGVSVEIVANEVREVNFPSTG